MNSTFPQKTTEPTVVWIDPKCLKEFFDPLRTKDPRTDFFGLYRRESEEFDKSYSDKYDEDLNTSLIFSGLFSAASSAFIIDVQSKLEQDPNDLTAAYLRILIHNMNNTLFPDADPSSTIWTGPPPHVVTVQSLLYASLATSLFAAFIAMLGKQWVKRYLRNRGGSAPEKSRDRQQKLDGLNKWHFRLVIESLPVMLQLALMLLGCALSLYLWSISRTVARVILSFTLFGFTLYIFFTLAATFYYECPYQTPASILTRAVFRHVKDSGSILGRSLRRLVAPLRRRSTVGERAEELPIAVVVPQGGRVFEDLSVDWEVYRGDSRCISWVLDYTTDPDVITSSAQLAVDMIWYPEVPGIVSPHILADRFFDCYWDGQVVAGRLEDASSRGMALASVLSTCLVLKPEDQVLDGLCQRIWKGIEKGVTFDPKCRVVQLTLGFVTGPFGTCSLPLYDNLHPLSAPVKVCLSRVLLQTFWRRADARHMSRPRGYQVEQLCKDLMADGDNTHTILRTTCFLILAIFLGLEVDHHDLYLPNTSGALKTAYTCFYRRLWDGIVDLDHAKWNMSIKALSASGYLNPFEIEMETGFSLITHILDSSISEERQCQATNKVAQLLGNFFFHQEGVGEPFQAKPEWVPPLLGFLSLSEKFRDRQALSCGGSIALRILSATQEHPLEDIQILSVDVCAEIITVLSSTLLPIHPLQSRSIALHVFRAFTPNWFSPQVEMVATQSLEDLIRAIGDPFPFIQDTSPVDGPSLLQETRYTPVDAVLVLIGFASSDLWRNHLLPSNFDTCEELLSTKQGRKTVIESMFALAERSLPKFLSTAAKIIAAIKCLEGLRRPRTAEVVIMWAWTVGVFDDYHYEDDNDGWPLVERETLSFYRTHQTRRLEVLEQHIIDKTMETKYIRFLDSLPGGFTYRVGGFQEQAPGPMDLQPQTPPSPGPAEGIRALHHSQARQLERLRRLLGRDPTAQAEFVAGEELGEAEGPLSVVPVLPEGWVCDYP